MTKPSNSSVIPVISRNTICYPLCAPRSPPPILHATKHPSPSTVTMSNTEAQNSRETEEKQYLHQQLICLPILPNLPEISPIRVCLVAGG